MSAVITFEHVYKSFPMYGHLTGGFKNLLFNLPKALREMRTHQFESLHDLSFEIKQGEAVGFIGRNGAGKSTTLGLIAGVLRPTRGLVKVQGRISPLLELGGGFHPDLSGRENIHLNGILLGLSNKTVKAKTPAIIDFAELGEFIDQPVRSYSSGMMARLGFAVVAHLEPEILLIDEVLAVGDAAFQKKCAAKIQDFKKAGVTIILVSHNTSDVSTLCDRAIWIENHRIRRQGPAVDITSEYIESTTSTPPARGLGSP